MWKDLRSTQTLKVNFFTVNFYAFLDIVLAVYISFVNLA